MGIALNLYEKLTEATDDKTRAKLIAEALEWVEEKAANSENTATHANVRESELRLQKEIKETEGRLQLEIKETEGRLQLEIEVVRKEIKETEGRLQLEIEGVRKEIKETEGQLKLEIEGVRKEIKEIEGRLKIEIKQVEVNLLKAINGQTRWFLGGLAILGVLFKMMDVFIK